MAESILLYIIQWSKYNNFNDSETKTMTLDSLKHGIINRNQILAIVVWDALQLDE